MRAAADRLRDVGGIRRSPPRHKQDPVSAAEKAWASSRYYNGEDANAEHVLVYGGTASFDDLMAASPCEGEDGAGWSATETSRFGRYALRFWNGLLSTEKLEHRK